MKKKSQSSFEFLMIFGIGFTIILILGSIFFNYSVEAQRSLDKEQINNLAQEIISNVERVYFLGNGNRITMKTNFPDNIINVTIVHKNLSGIYFDYLDIETFNINSQNITDNSHNIYETSKDYIRFNCSLTCSQSAIVNGEWISSYLDSDFSKGFKNIRIENNLMLINSFYYNKI